MSAEVNIHVCAEDINQHEMSSSMTPYLISLGRLSPRNTELTALARLTASQLLGLSCLLVPNSVIPTTYATSPRFYVGEGLNSLLHAYTASMSAKTAPKLKGIC